MSVSKTAKYQVWASTNGCCWYCGNTIEGRDATVDHIIPQSRGGSHKVSNLRPSCRQCNAFKNSYTPEEFRIAIKNSPCYGLERAIERAKVCAEFFPAGFAEEFISDVEILIERVRLSQIKFWGE